MRILLLVFTTLLTTACQFEYLVKSGYNQAKLLSRREDIQKVLEDPRIDAETKRKLRLAVDAKAFAESHLSLTHTKNYTSFVKLDTPYVSYVVSAAPRYRLEPYLWKFPLVGELPYKGFFSENEAKDEARMMEGKGFDTYVRGVSAFSTLGYFKDPVLSSMTAYRDHDLVNTIIHETVHATLFVKSSAEFNERLAVFLGNKGTEMFYLDREGAASPTLKLIRDDNRDDEIFSKFFSAEYESLKKWYEAQTAVTDEQKKARFQEMQKRFESSVAPQIKGQQYKSFGTRAINNAELIVYSTYMSDLSDFECVFTKKDRDFKKMLDLLKTFESSDNPETQLKENCKISN